MTIMKDIIEAAFEDRAHITPDSASKEIKEASLISLLAESGVICARSSNAASIISFIIVIIKKS